PRDDEPLELLHPGKADRLLADAFYQAAVAGDDPGAVVHDLAAEAGAHRLLGDGEADGIREALAKGAGRRLDTRHMAVFRMARGDRAPLAEVPDLVERHVLVAGQVEQRVDQHGAVAGRE